MYQTHQLEQNIAVDVGLVNHLLPQQPIGVMPYSKQWQESLCKLTKALLERALDAELDHHLGYHKGESTPLEQGNRRNGSSLKTILTEWGVVELEIPRDRQGTFYPILVPRRQRRFSGLSGLVLAMYTQRHCLAMVERYLEMLYPPNTSPTLLTEVAEAVVDEVADFQTRPLECNYTVVSFSELAVKMPDSAGEDQLNVRLALGISPDGSCQIIGVWNALDDQVDFWRQALNDMGDRGVQSLSMAFIDEKIPAFQGSSSYLVATRLPALGMGAKGRQSA